MRPFVSPASAARRAAGDVHAVKGDAARVGHQKARHQREQRGLARAIGANQPHLLTLLQACLGFNVEDLMAVLLADGFKADHGWRLEPR
jgi:hypothetical protein